MWSDTLMQLITFAHFEIRLATRGRTIHSLPLVNLMDLRVTGIGAPIIQEPKKTPQSSLGKAPSKTF